MKNLLLPCLLLAFLYSASQSKKRLSDKDKLDTCIAAHTSYFLFDGVKPSGKGWDTLEGLFAKNQFVAWGEYHNSPQLSALSAYAMGGAAQQGFKTLCVETSPFVAAELQRISRAANPAGTLERIFQKGYPGIGTFPFFHTKADALILLAANQYRFNLWGIDQEFQMCFSYAINKVYNAQSKKVRAKFKTVIDSLQATWWYPGTQLLDSFSNAVSNKYFRQILDDIRTSKEIYRYNKNEDRAALMKRNFFSYYDRTGKEKVFFKMGSNHLAKGINLQTNVFDIGNAVYELAQRNKTGFANVYFMARFTSEKGIITDDLYSDENENPKVFSQLYNKDKWVLVDIRSLRVRMRYDNSLTRDAYAIIEKYDYVLISPEILAQ